MFCPNDACSSAHFTSLPFGLIGTMGAFSKGYAFVCGGARSAYRDCTTKVTANYCQRNAECVTTAGEAMWCTGPKIKSCYVYDRYITRSWIQSPISLSTARAYAALVILPDGRVWILGGAGSSSILASTEIVEISDSGIAKISAGPDLPEPLMGHCAAMLTVTQVVVTGGYSTLINDYLPLVYTFDFKTNTWTSQPTLTNRARIDGSCLSVNVAGVPSVLMAGGWNNLALSDTGVYSSANLKWIFFNGSDPSSTPLLNPIRSSVLIERNQKYILLGGVSCDSNGRSCKQTDKSKIKLSGGIAQR